MRVAHNIATTTRLGFTQGKALSERIDETFNEIPPEFRTKTGRLRQPVNYKFDDSTDDEGDFM